MGGEPVLSRFAVLTRSKNGRTKRRLILDLKQSGVTACTQQAYRVVLPRGSDTIRDALFLLSVGAADTDGTDFEWFVSGFVDAF